MSVTDRAAQPLLLRNRAETGAGCAFSHPGPCGWGQLAAGPGTRLPAPPYPPGVPACTLARPCCPAPDVTKDRQARGGGTGIGLTLCFEGQTEDRPWCPRNILSILFLSSCHSHSVSFSEGFVVGLERSVFESEFNKILIYTREERGEETDMWDIVLTYIEIEDQSFFQWDMLEMSNIILIVSRDICY